MQNGCNAHETLVIPFELRASFIGKLAFLALQAFRIYHGNPSKTGRRFSKRKVARGTSASLMFHCVWIARICSCFDTYTNPCESREYVVVLILIRIFFYEEKMRIARHWFNHLHTTLFSHLFFLSTIRETSGNFFLATSSYLAKRKTHKSLIVTCI